MLRFFKSSEKEWSRRLESATQLQREGRSEAARSDFEAALRLAQEMPPDDDRRLRTLALAAHFYVSADLGDAAQECYAELLDLTERASGADDPAVARVLSQMAAADEAEDRLGRAERLYRRALRIFESSVGEGHRRTGRTAGALANVLRLQQEWTESIQLYLTAIEIERKFAAGDVATLLRMYLQLSQIYRTLERDAQLEEVYLNAAELVKGTAGRDQLGMVTVLNRLASFYFHRQRLEEAAQQYELIYETQRKILGNFHPAQASTLGRLGQIAELQQKFPDATEYYSQRVEILAENQSRTGAIQHAAALCDLAYLFCRRTQWNDARETYQRAIDRSREALSPGHPNLATPLIGMALVLEKLGELDRAEALANQALELCGAMGSRPHPNLAQTLELLARIAESRQDWEQAEQLTTALIEAEEQFERKDPIRDVRRLRRLLGIDLHLGKYRKALAHCDEAINRLRYDPELSKTSDLKDLEVERLQILDLPMDAEE